MGLLLLGMWGAGQDRVRGVREARSGQMHRLPRGTAASQMRPDQAGGSNSGEYGRRLLRVREAVSGNFDGVLRQETRCAVANRSAATPWV